MKRRVVILSGMGGRFLAAVLRSLDGDGRAA